MSVETPKCPTCDSSSHVVLVNTTQKIGTAVGGVAGGAAGYYGASTGAATGATIGSVIRSGDILMEIVLRGFVC